MSEPLRKPAGYKLSGLPVRIAAWIVLTVIALAAIRIIDRHADVLQQQGRQKALEKAENVTGGP